MNDRQKALNQFLLNHPFEYTKRINILCALKEYYYEKGTEEFDIRTSDIYYSNEAALLNKDINYLKYNATKIIIGNSQKGIKYATKDEFVEYAKRKREAIRRQAILLNVQARKYGLNNQIDLEGNIVESTIKNDNIRY